VVGEIIRPIRHTLHAVPGAALGRLRRVVSHPVALAQCSRFFDEHRWIEAVASYDTSGAAREVARSGDPAVAAIAAHDVAARYGLEVLATDIHDRADNVTRFFVIARADAAVIAAGGADGIAAVPACNRSALLIDAEDRPGALSHVLSSFAQRGVNLTHIQSMPGDVPFTYRFVLELDAGAGSEVADAIAALRAGGASVRVLGSFPAARQSA
jgi:prephenate dehydratase